ncbi:MAG: TetR/AcrR family transcriptional regulator [Fidelibacterota bacterium]
MGRPKKLDRTSKTQIRDRILREAEKLFAKKGFSSTTTREIATASRVNNALIHYYFKGKKELYKSIIRANVDEVFQAIIEGITHDLSAENAIDVIVESYYKLFTKKQNILPSFLARELADGAPFVKEIVAEKHNTILPACETAMQTTTILPEHLMSMIFTIGIILFSILSRPIQMTLSHQLGITEPDLETVKELIKKFVKQGIIL